MHFNNLGRMTNMTGIDYRKTPLKSSSPETKRPMHLILRLQNLVVRPNIACTSDDPRLILIFFMAMASLFLNLVSSFLSGY